MRINLTVFIYEPLYWRVTADVVFVALFPLNRRLFNKIVAYQLLFCMVTLLGSSNNHDDREGDVKIDFKKNMQQVWLINKNNLNVQRTFGRNFLAIVARVTLSNFNAIVPLGPVQMYPDISGAPNDRFLGNICSEPSRMAKIFESPRTAKNFENVSWWLFVGLRVSGFVWFVHLRISDFVVISRFWFRHLEIS